jgi:soluble lytic murein transglycosylase-like protein
MKRLIPCIHLAFLSLSGICAAEPQAKDAPAAAKQIVAPAAAEHPADSTEAMQLSIDKQRTSVRSQIGDGGEADPFFTTPWAAPREIPLPLTCVPMAESDVIPLVKEASLAQNLSTDLIRAVIRRESASLWCAVSDKGAVGLMQLMPDVARQFGVDPYDPKQNVQAGTKYLKQLMTRYKGDTKLALAAYNAGPVVVDAAGGVPAIQETTAFVNAILKDIESKIPAAPKP